MTHKRGRRKQTPAAKLQGAS